MGLLRDLFGGVARVTADEYADLTRADHHTDEQHARFMELMQTLPEMARREIERERGR